MWYAKIKQHDYGGRRKPWARITLAGRRERSLSKWVGGLQGVCGRIRDPTTLSKVPHV
jgi:hypothetical protein